MYLMIFFMVMSVKHIEGAAGNDSSVNFTSCEEFLEGTTTFDPALVIDVDWKIFYFWELEYEKSYQVRFSSPTAELLQRYKAVLKSDLKPPVVWSDAELFMETSIDISALYIRTNISGLYRILPAYALSMEAIPNFLVAMKMVGPGYLGLMNCKYRFCYALAPIDKMPAKIEIEDVALQFNFRSEVNFSYVHPTPSPLATQPIPQDDGHLDELEQDLDKFDFI